MKRTLLTLLLGILTIGAFATDLYDFKSGYIYYKILSSTDKTVAVSAKDDSYNTYSGTITVPSEVYYNGSTYTVTAVGDGAFSVLFDDAEDSDLAVVNLPATITSIGEYAFENCFYLTSMIIPSAVTSIGEGAFLNCASLSYIKIPAGVTEINPHTFSCCASLDDVTIPARVTTIGERAFYACVGLTYVSLPNALESIGDWAFGFCNNLSHICFHGLSAFSLGNDAFNGVAPTGVLSAPVVSGYDVLLMYIGDGTGWTLDDNIDTSVITYTTTDNQPIDPTCDYFDAEYFAYSWDEDTNKGTLYFNGSLTQVGYGAFYNCSTLKTVTLPQSVAEIGEGAFCNCLALESINIPSCVTIIGDLAFASCHSLTSITLPDGVTTIGKQTFFNCVSLTSFTFPQYLTSIGEEAFAYCYNITSIDIPANVKSIGDSAFKSCQALASITCVAENAPTLGTNAFYDIAPTGTATLFPEMSYTAWVNALPSGWDIHFFYENQLGVITYTTTDGQPITLSDSDAMLLHTYSSGQGRIVYCGVLAKLDYSLFSESETLSSITLPEGMTALEDQAFWNCSNLTSVTLPSTLTIIKSEAFRYCGKLTSITIPANVTEVENNAFTECSSLSSITCQATTAPSLGRSALGGLPSSGTFTYPVGATGYDAWLTALPSGWTVNTAAPSGNSVIAYTATSKVTPYKTDVFGATLVDNQFDTSTGEGYLLFDGPVTTIGEQAFDKCSSLTSITIPASVVSIDASSFLYCSALTSITVDAGNTVYSSPNGCNAIIETATGTLLLGCSTTVIPEGVTSIGLNAFDNCPLTSLNLPSTLTSIGAGAFWQCMELASITLPGSLTFIDNMAFNYCTSLTSITSEATKAPRLGIGVFDDIPTSGTLYVPEGATGYEAWLEALGSGWTLATITTNVTFTIRHTGLTEQTYELIPGTFTYTFTDYCLPGNTITALTFNGVDVLDQLVDGTYTTPVIMTNSVFEITFSGVGGSSLEGDVNNDGTVDVSDVTKVVSIILSK